MIISGSGFHAFMDGDLRGGLESQKQKVKEVIRGDETDADIDRIVIDFRIEPIILNEAGITISDREEMIDADMFPSGFWPDQGNSYPKPVVRYHIPFSGDGQLFHIKPSTFLMRTEEIIVDNNEVCFDVVNWSGDLQQVKRDFDSTLKYLRDQNTNVTAEVQKYNDGLRVHIVVAVGEAKNKNKQNDDFISSLGFPRKSNG